jgi:hypothetical protein
LRGAPLKRDGSGPDRSLADFMFCKWAAERGWSIEDTAAKLAEVSEKAQAGIRLKNDKGYPLLTARNANAAVERERSRRQSLKSTAHPPPVTNARSRGEGGTSPTGHSQRTPVDAS